MKKRMYPNAAIRLYMHTYTGLIAHTGIFGRPVNDGSYRKMLNKGLVTYHRMLPSIARNVSTDYVNDIINTLLNQGLALHESTRSNQR